MLSSDCDSALTQQDRLYWRPPPPWIAPVTSPAALCRGSKWSCADLQIHSARLQKVRWTQRRSIFSPSNSICSVPTCPSTVSSHEAHTPPRRHRSYGTTQCTQHRRSWSHLREHLSTQTPYTHSSHTQAQHGHDQSQIK